MYSIYLPLMCRQHELLNQKGFCQHCQTKLVLNLRLRPRVGEALGSVFLPSGEAASLQLMHARMAMSVVKMLENVSCPKHPKGSMAPVGPSDLHALQQLKVNAMWDSAPAYSKGPSASVGATLAKYFEKPSVACRLCQVP